MPALQLTNDELLALASTVDQAVASAQRAQKTGKSPQIVEVYRLHEATLGELKAKIIKATALKG